MEFQEVVPPCFLEPFNVLDLNNELAELNDQIGKKQIGF